MLFKRLTEQVGEHQRIKDIASLVTQRADFSEIETGLYVSTENIEQNKEGIVSFGSTSAHERVVRFLPRDILLANIRPYFKKIHLSNEIGGCNSDVLCLRGANENLSFLLYFALRQDSFFDYVMSGAKGTKMPRGDKAHILEYELPALNEQSLKRFGLQSEILLRSIRARKREINVLKRTRNTMLDSLS